LKQESKQAKTHIKPDADHELNHTSGQYLIMRINTIKRD